MADNKKTGPAFGKPGDIDPDDPFAELARLIAPETASRPRDRSGEPPEIADDLTDELLREFELPAGPEPDYPPEPEPAAKPYYEFVSFEPVHRTDPRDAAPEEAYYPEEEPEIPTPDALASELERSFAAFDVSADEHPAGPAWLDEEEDASAAEAWSAPAAPTVPDYAYDQDERGYVPDEASADVFDDDYNFEQAASQSRDTAAQGRPGATTHVEDELELDLNELELELSEIDLPVDNGPEPLEKMVAQEPVDDDIFDPAALISTDEPPRPIDELDLPVMAHDEPVETGPVPYEFDIDEELADVMASQQPVAADTVYDPSASEEQPLEEQGVAFAASRGQGYGAGIETVLEDDFQYALQENGQRPVYRADDDDIDDERPHRAAAFMGYGRVILASLIGLVVVVLLVFAGMRFFREEGIGEPLVITADNSSVKEAPEDPGGEVVPNQDNAVFNGGSSTLGDEPRQGTLIASDQQPTDVEAVAPNPIAETAQNAQAPAANPAPAEIEPRRVRTIIVKPDGTLVERSTDVPSTSTARGIETVTALPDERGNLVASGAEDSASGNTFMPPAEDDSGEAAETVENTPADVASAELPAEGEVATAEEPAAPVGDFGIPNPPVPTPRPARPAGSATVASAAPAAVASAAPAPTTSAQATLPYAMQIASLPSEQEARQAYQRIAAQHPSVLGRRPVEFVPAAIAGKGTYYRVRIGANSLSEAIALCESFKAEGGSCFVPR